MATPEAHRDMALGVSSSATRHTARPRAAGVLECVPAHLPGEGAASRAAPALLVAVGLHRRGVVHDLGGDGRLSDVLLHTIGHLGLRRHAAAPHGSRFRSTRAQRAPVVGASDGARGRPPSGTGVLCRRLQASAAIQLGHRHGTVRDHARVLVHGLPAAVGPAQLLGGHGRHEPGQLCAAVRRRSDGLAHRRPADRPSHASTLLRSACRCAACGYRAATHGAHLARPQGRFRRAPRWCRSVCRRSDRPCQQFRRRPPGNGNHHDRVAAGSHRVGHRERRQGATARCGRP